MFARKRRSKEEIRERRSQARQTAVLRIGSISDGFRASFCLVKNISREGVQVKLYAPIPLGTPVQFKVGDGRLLNGRIVWKREQIAGIEFDGELDPGAMLRVADPEPTCRRRAPRVRAAARATLRVGGRTIAAELCDISAIGTKLKTRKPLTDGAPGVLTLPDLPPIRGFVRWAKGQMSGFMFERPLSVPLIACWIAGRRRVSHDIDC